MPTFKQIIQEHIRKQVDKNDAQCVHIILTILYSVTDAIILRKEEKASNNHKQHNGYYQSTNPLSLEISIRPADDVMEFDQPLCRTTLLLFFAADIGEGGLFDDPTSGDGRPTGGSGELWGNSRLANGL